ncbi:MAG: 3-phosphoshikimate 1-carboxyvinyltransferase [Oceanibaculum nanhaiense]|nr:3-phosphoshikimate 1-carboxyvinyltransferase [Oceanibaculum nanhaiense]
MHPLVSRRAEALRGAVTAPGDKSISHRALMFGGLAIGETAIHGLLEGEDVLNTAKAMRAYGATLRRGEDGVWHVRGVGVGGLAEPEDMLDLGNSGTGARLLMGLAAGHPIISFFTGDASLRRRPMARVMKPLAEMGARFVSREGGRLPLAVTGASSPLPIEYTLPVASAQVKSAILLAGLTAPGETIVIEPEPTRDHSERMLRHFGAAVRVEDRADGTRAVTLTGQPELVAATVRVPGDPSSAAFPAVAALLVPGSEVRIANVGANPLRFGLFETLLEMGADIALENRREEAGEPVVDLLIRAGALKGVVVPPRRAPSMIDEYPILAMAAACADGPTVMEGLAELRVKESDRLGAVARGLAACGVEIEEGPDRLVVHGKGRPPAGGAMIAANLDHRIAMAFAVLGMVTEKPVSIDDGEPIATSFPGFVPMMNGLGADIADQPPQPPQASGAPA